MGIIGTLLHANAGVILVASWEERRAWRDEFRSLGVELVRDRVRLAAWDDEKLQEARRGTARPGSSSPSKLPPLQNGGGLSEMGAQAASDSRNDGFAAQLRSGANVIDAFCLVPTLPTPNSCGPMPGHGNSCLRSGVELVA
jgi:hypothetical protein